VFTKDFPELPRDQAKEAIKKWISMELPAVDPKVVEAGYNINEFRGFNAYLNAAQLEVIRGHPLVKYVEEDSIATITDFTDRQDWGQVRVHQPARFLTTNNAQYTYDGTTYPNQNLDITVWNFIEGVQNPFRNTGKKAEVCIIDTGVRATHQEILGRVDAQVDYTNSTNGFQDGNGHGTHVAGSCCGTFRGVAPESRISSAKALSNSGSGQWAWIISAIEWCAKRNTNRQTTYIMSMSLGGGLTVAVNEAINAASTDTIPVVAAWNENMNSCTRSPASAHRSITVMASDKDDNKASFSNFGNCSDIWAPGVSVHSGWYTSDTAYNTISGTSMATPLVSGVIAGYADDDKGSGLTRDEAMRELQNVGQWNIIKSNPANTPNLFVFTG
jgi:subtilisin family serine protease